MPFNTPRIRDACAAIHGYAYQIDVTVQRWLLLEPDQVLELERGEDIDVIAVAEAGSSEERERCLDQIKVRQRPLNLKSPAALEAMANFSAHLLANPELALRFRFISTAGVGRERERMHPTSSGIELWEGLRLGTVTGAAAQRAYPALRKLLKAQKCPPKFDPSTWKVFQDLLRGSAADFKGFVQRFEWGMKAAPREDVRRDAQALLTSHHSISAASAKEAYRVLFMEVLDLMAQRDRPKILDHALLADCLQRRITGSEESDRFSRLEDVLGTLLRDIHGQTAQIAPMYREVRVIAGNLRETRALVERLVPPAPTIERYLSDLVGASLARCKAAWRALGVTKAEADDMAADMEVGWEFPWRDLTAEEPMRVLVAEFGAGKSLAMERCLQRTAAEALQDPGAPLPVYLRATSRRADLSLDVEAALSKVVDCTVHPILVLVDGADEAGEDATLALISEGRAMLDRWPNARLIIASRPLPSFDRLDEAMAHPALGPGQSIQLVTRFSPRAITQGQWYSWPQPLTDALQRPLFCILLGVYYQRHPNAGVHSTGQLLFDLVDRSLQGSRTKVELLRELLLDLAVQSLDRGTEVYLGEVRGAEGARTALLATGIVRIEGRTLAFTLHVLAQWFAAQALLEGKVDLAALLHSPTRVERWRYAFALLVGNNGGAAVDRVMASLARENPVLAGQVIDEAFASWVEPGRTGEVPSEVVEPAIQQAMDAWREGFGPLATLVTPTWPDGRPAPLKVDQRSGHLIAHWMRGADEPHQGRGFHWAVSYSVEPTEQPAWVWNWTRRLVQRKLEDVVKGPMLLPTGGPIWQETVWALSLRILARGGLDGAPVPVKLALETLRRMEGQQTFFHPNWYRFPHRWLAAQLEALQAADTILIACPWPGPDQRPRDGYIYSMYSPERLLKRTSAIFLAAVQAYPAIIATWLPRLGRKMSMAALLPARLTGRISPARRQAGSDTVPALEWLVEPLQEGAPSEVAFELSDETRSEEEKYECYERAMALRRQSAAWLAYYFHSESLHEIFMENPARELIESWLVSDLRGSRWL